MISLFTNTAFFSDICEEIRLFIDTRKVEELIEEEPTADELCILHNLSESGDKISSIAKIYKSGVFFFEYEYMSAGAEGMLEKKRALKRASKISVYRALEKTYGTGMPWGSLTGIRPTKLLRDSEETLGEEGARALFLNGFDVSKNKYDLAKTIINVQKGYQPKDNDIDLYVGIPFCVTRCAYCSFASNTPDVFKGAVDKYTDALLSELEAAESILRDKNIRAVYIGGGTPTALDNRNFEKVLAAVSKYAKNASEYTVEAGRPDTITEEKLRIIRGSGAKRISVNTQTLKDETLIRIGRQHTADDFFRAYEIADKMGFNINVDIIAGLPGEDQRDFESTMLKIRELSPGNITVHTLAIKRASVFASENTGAFPGDTETYCMTDYARTILESCGYLPYYMYRQKYMKGCLENTGYTKKGYECLYNIDNMEELCSVAAFGAGAISKRVYNGGERIERAANIKDLRLYIEKPYEMAERKQNLFE